MRTLFARVRSFWRGLRRSDQLWAEMDEEMRFHLEMEAERLMRQRGLDAPEARRQAAVAFGGVEKYKEAGHDVRGLNWINGMALDFRLGVRMLLKYPGLTLTGVLGMAVAIAFGAGIFSFTSTILDPELPLDEGDRIVAIQNFSAARSDTDRGTHLHDLPAWREELRAVEQLGAFVTVDRNLITPDGTAEPLRVAEMTASGFRIARVAPLLGRYLVEEDEREGAPPVVVIGYDLWQKRFGGRTDVVGQALRLGTAQHTVVGVMPEGFAFPINNRLWAPLRLDPADYERGRAPPMDVFGRLAPGATLEEARAQLETIGRRMAAAHPETHQHLRPQILPYARSFLDAPELAWLFYLIQLLVSLLLVVIAVNVAILVYARTATRTGEIAVRLALGASRARVMAQLFAEALVLSSIAAVVGLVAARFSLGLTAEYVARVGGEELPFWWNIGLSPRTVVYTAGLAILAAVIVGVLPALKITGRRMQASLRELGGGTGMRMGRTWTVLIVAQVAVAVAILPAAVALGWKEFLPAGVAAARFDARELLRAQIGMDREAPPSARAEAYERELAARFADRQTELARRLEAEPGVAAVTFASGVAPGTIEMESARPGAEPWTIGVRFVRMDPALFEVFDVSLLAGRLFQADDLSGAATAVVVNRSFADHHLGGGSAVGRRFRYDSTDGGVRPGGVQQGGWYEVVGVVADFPIELPYAWQGVPTLYHPAAPGTVNPVNLVVRTQGVEPESLAPRLREIATATDPTLRLYEVNSLTDLQRQEQRTRHVLTLGVLIGVLSVLLLSAAGIHALMSFTVARRRKEIGIRTALGARPRRILASVFARALRQLGLGVAIGGSLGSAAILGGEIPAGRAAALLSIVVAVVLTVGLVAVLGPARQGLRIQPMEALRED